ncbi:MAG TPA: TRAP transporter small permease subunit [Caldilineaceae bacterium]|nr:TRAP transporter small permease subunit [Caldilineaceae bacterium]
MRPLLRYAATIDAVSAFFGRIANYTVVLVVVVGFFNVAARYIGRYIGVTLASNAYIELQWYLFSVIFFLGFGDTLRRGVNVRVDFFYARFSTKQKAWIDLLGTLLFLIPFCLIGLAVTYTPVLRSWLTWEMSSDANGLPRAPIKSFIIVAFVLLLLQSTAQAIKYLAVILGYEDAVGQIQAEETM